LIPGVNRYTAEFPPDKRNTGPAAVHLPDSFGVVIPFRYAELENCRFNLKENNLIQKTYNYYFDDGMSSFISSDTVLNQVWDMCKYTMKQPLSPGSILTETERESL